MDHELRELERTARSRATDGEAQWRFVQGLRRAGERERAAVELWRLTRQGDKQAFTALLHETTRGLGSNPVERRGAVLAPSGHFRTLEQHGDNVLYRDDQKLVLGSLRDLCVRWSHVGAVGELQSAGGASFAVVLKGDGELSRIDLRDGAVVASARWPGSYDGLAVLMDRGVAWRSEGGVLRLEGLDVGLDFGRRLWSREMELEPTRVSVLHAWGVSPVRVMVHSREELHALDADTGEIAWTAPPPRPGEGRLAHRERSLRWISQGTHHMYELDPERGVVLAEVSPPWDAARQPWAWYGAWDAHHSLIVGRSWVTVPTSRGTPARTEVRHELALYDDEARALRWRHGFGREFPMSALGGDVVYSVVPEGEELALRVHDLRSGEVLLRRVVEGVPAAAPPLVLGVDGAVILLCGETLVRLEGGPVRA